MKKFLNILSIFASAILSIIFVITTFSIVLYYSVAGLLHRFAGIFVDSAIQHILTKLIISLIICFAIMIASIVACVLFKRKKAFTA
ncbi:MAG: hypothetical protein IKJ59_07980 [Clostridia bacterium]|nr:hypothetical protein [Clostridia bacterium]